MTTRERREARAARRRKWAASAANTAEEKFRAADKLASVIPLGQPILVGHHSEGHARRDQARIMSAGFAGVDAQKRAKRHAAKADEIDRQLERSVFDDDPDAIERLRERIAENEEKVAEALAINRAFRKAAGKPPLSSDAITAGLRAIAALDLGGGRHVSVDVFERCVNVMTPPLLVSAPCGTDHLRAAIRRDQARIRALLS